MAKRVFKFIILSAIFLLLCAMLLPLRTYSAADLGAIKSKKKSQIVIIADVSGSMGKADASFYIKDALKLCADLTPYDAQVALVTISDKIISQTPLLNADAPTEREAFKNMVNNISYYGNTNFRVGFDKALEILDTSDAESADKHIIFLGDFSEGGYTKLNKAKSLEEIEQLDLLGNRAYERKVTIDLVLLSDPPPDSAIALGILTLPDKTGGHTFRLSQAQDLSKAVSDIFFSSFEYLRSSIRVDNILNAQSLNIFMPTDNVNRARIYISASKPVLDVSASYAGAALDGEFNRSYAMVRLNRPSQEGVSVTLNSTQYVMAEIFLLLDYNPTLSVSVSNEAVMPEIEILPKDSVAPEVEVWPFQVTTLTAVINDVTNGKPLLVAPFPENLIYDVTLLDPSGQKTPLEPDLSDPSKFTFCPTKYGVYKVSARLNVDGMEIGSFNDSVTIENIIPPIVIEEPEPKDWTVPIAVAVALLLIITALIIVLRQKRREAEFVGVAEMASNYRFHGKLSIYAIMLEGGNRELRPFDFGLNNLSEKRVSLRNILDSANAKGFYSGAQDILFLVGPEDSLILRNNSKAVIKVMGRTFESRSKVQLFYGQKAYIIFEQNENELEIVYRKVKEEESDISCF